MKQIEVKIINPSAIDEAERMMVAMARLTQRSHKIATMADFDVLLNMPYKQDTAKTMSELPHPTIQKFGLINIAIVGASRRFLAQITRHQNEIKFMSGSLQYSDYSEDGQFCVPYEMTAYDVEHLHIDRPFPISATSFYIDGCKRDLEEYAQLAQIVGNDAAGYKMPQGMRNVLVMSVLPYELKHIITQRSCNRNTLETQYVLLRIWEELHGTSPMWDDCGAPCTHGYCPEGKMSCHHFLHSVPVDDYMEAHNCGLPTALLDTHFKYIRRND